MNIYALLDEFLWTSWSLAMAAVTPFIVVFGPEI